MSNTQPTPRQQRNLTVLKAMENQGGATGYQRYLEAANTSRGLAIQALGDVRVFSNNVAVTGDVYAVVAYEHLSVTTTDGHTGSGGGWGPGLGGVEFVGDLNYDSWDVLCNGDCDFVIAAGGDEAGGIVVQFSRNGQSIANLAGGGEGLGGLLGITGTFTWSAV